MSSSTIQSQKAVYQQPKLIIAALCWGVLLSASLEITNLEQTFRQSICGPWGCGPPLAALMSWHTFWLIFLAFPFGLLANSYRHMRAFTRGCRLAILAGLLTLVGIGIHEYLTWYQTASDWARPYYVKRYLFVVINLWYVPIVQVILYGIIGDVLSMTMRPRQNR